MSDLINRRDAIKALLDSSVWDCINKNAAVGKCVTTIMDLPSADKDIEIIKAEAHAKGIDSERKRISDWCRPKGEWTSRNSYWHTAICSNCNKVTMFEEWGGEVIEYDFCPNCGAKMKGTSND